MNQTRSASPPSGRNADSPWQLPWSAWKEIGLRTWREAGDDNIGLVAAGVAFYGFLALVPLLGAIVLSYGLIADPETVVSNVRSLTSVMPADAAKLVGEQLMNVVQTSGGKKGLGVLAALAIAVFGARNGAGSVITALNIAYEEKEKRSFIRLNLLTIGMTAASVVVAVVAVVAIAALGHLEKLFPGAPGFVLVLGKVLTYVLLVLAGAAGAATLYRYGPSRAKARWTWLTPGSLFAGILWLVLTLGFGIYVANFGNYDATYGSLGGVIVLLTWLYLSSYILLFGAELNSELEHQTARDTTDGRDVALGQRGAWAADHVAEGSQPQGNPAAPALSGGDAAPPPPAPAVPTPLEQYLTARFGARIGRIAGLKKVGMLPTLAATAGLGLIRKPGGAGKGALLVAAASGLAWLTRDKEERR